MSELNRDFLQQRCGWDLCSNHNNLMKQRDFFEADASKVLKLIQQEKRKVAEEIFSKLEDLAVRDWAEEGVLLRSEIDESDVIELKQKYLGESEGE